MAGMILHALAQWCWLILARLAGIVTGLLGDKRGWWAENTPFGWAVFDYGRYKSKEEMTRMISNDSTGHQ